MLKIKEGTDLSKYGFVFNYAFGNYVREIEKDIKIFVYDDRCISLRILGTSRYSVDNLGFLYDMFADGVLKKVDKWKKNELI